MDYTTYEEPKLHLFHDSQILFIFFNSVENMLDLPDTMLQLIDLESLSYSAQMNQHFGYVPSNFL